MNAESFRENQKAWVLTTPHPFNEKPVTTATLLISRHLKCYTECYTSATCSTWSYLIEIMAKFDHLKSAASRNHGEKAKC